MSSNNSDNEQETQCSNQSFDQINEPMQEDQTEEDSDYLTDREQDSDEQIVEFPEEKASSNLKIDEDSPDTNSESNSSYPQSQTIQTTYTANEFPSQNDFIHSKNIKPIPKDYNYSTCQNYIEINTSLSIENKPESELEKESQEKPRQREYIEYNDYQVIKSEFTKEGYIVYVKIECRVARYAQQECKIKGNQLMIFIDKETKKFYFGKTTDDTNRQQQKNDDDDDGEDYYENQDDQSDDVQDRKEGEIDEVNDFQIINVVQCIKIKMEVINRLESFLNNIDNIESKYMLIQPCEYWFSFQQNQDCVEQFKKHGKIAFESQTIKGVEGRQGSPQYEFITNESERTTYQQYIDFEIQKQEKKLDKYQFQALKHALSNQNALIQGPPGTGKTFIASTTTKVLCETYCQYSGKPILVISKKNESLDQLLTKIYEQNKSVDILRIGTRTTSELINTFTVQKKGGPYKQLTPVQGFDQINEELQKFISGVQEKKLVLKKFIKLLKKALGLGSNISIDETVANRLLFQWFRNDLSCQNIIISLQQCKIDLNEEQIIILNDCLIAQNDETKVKTEKSLKNDLRLLNALSELSSFSDFTSGFRTALQKFFTFVDVYNLIQVMRQYERKSTNNKIKSYQKYQSEISEFMQEQQVIGMTMTGFHMNYAAICELEPEIVIVEEASEIIESEFLPILSPFLKHLIQIGDHKQLRPLVKSNTLKYKYNYNSSYFERLIRFNKIQLVTLYEQRRMIPEFANFTRLFYGPQYIDSYSTKKRDFVSEISKNGMYMLQHSFPEQIMPDLSFTNAFEAEYIVRFIQKLIREEYDPTRITVISMYKTQKILIQNKLKRLCIKKKGETLLLRKVNVCTVDQFQGNENDIIILSCVRSNKDKKIGFVANEHRINVAFSRAKQGFFCIGNFSLMESLSYKWQQINKLSQQQKTLGFQKQYIPYMYQRICEQTIKQLQNDAFLSKKKQIDINICYNCNEESHIGNCWDQICVQQSNQKIQQNQIQHSHQNLSLHSQIHSQSHQHSYCHQQQKPLPQYQHQQQKPLHQYQHQHQHQHKGQHQPQNLYQHQSQDQHYNKNQDQHYTNFPTLHQANNYNQKEEFNGWNNPTEYQHKIIIDDLSSKFQMKTKLTKKQKQQLQKSQQQQIAS